MSLLWASSAWAQEPPRARAVLLLFSATPGVQSVIAEQREIEKTLPEQLGAPVNLFVEYLDLSDDPGSAYRQRLARFLADKYATRPVDIVLVQRREALDLLLENRESLLAGTPVVFFEMFAPEYERLGRLPADVTGVVTTIPSAWPAIITTRPNTTRVVLVAGAAPVERMYAALVQRQLEADAGARATVEMLDGVPLARQIERVAALPSDAAVLLTTYARTASGPVLTGTVTDALSRVSSAPVYGMVEPYVGVGVVGGHVVQLTGIARQAAAKAVRILNGASPAALPPEPESSSAFVFDARQLRRWQISESVLPPSSVVLFREPTLWSEHKWTGIAVIGVLLAQGLLIGGLVVERRTRRRAQTNLADAEQRYRTVADYAADWEYWRQPDGSLRYVSPSSEAITGYTPAAFMARPELLTEIVVEADRERWAAHMQAVQSSDTPPPHVIQFRIRTRNGDIRWIEQVCSRITGPDGRDLGARASNRDTTERRKTEDDLRRVIDENQQLRDRLEIDNAYMREQLQQEGGIAGLIGDTEIIRYVAAKVRQVASTPSTVLLQGETGVGKSLIAQAIHDLSTRRSRPLVTLDCAALPAALIESELFGHEKGAFTGAHGRRLGRFEIANGGTLFLDEIGDLPLELQGKLLRAVQDGEFERVGSNATIKVDVRLIAATHRKLDDEVRAGRFRQDLLYRLNVFPITVPSLRQRREDIPVLVGHFLQRHCRALRMPVPQVSKATMKALQAHEWPGNIRELENVIERGLIAGRGRERFEFVDDDRSGILAARTAPEPDEARTLAQIEHDHIVQTLERLQWRIEGRGGAADVLGINASTLRSRMRKHGIRRPVDSAQTILAS